jgi:hypothetical protein
MILCFIMMGALALMVMGHEKRYHILCKRHRLGSLYWIWRLMALHLAAVADHHDTFVFLVCM